MASGMSCIRNVKMPAAGDVFPNACYIGGECVVALEKRVLPYERLASRGLRSLGANFGQFPLLRRLPKTLVEGLLPNPFNGNRSIPPAFLGGGGY